MAWAVVRPINSEDDFNNRFERKKTARINKFSADPIIPRTPKTFLSLGSGGGSVYGSALMAGLTVAAGV